MIVRITEKFRATFLDHDKRGFYYSMLTLIALTIIYILSPKINFLGGQHYETGDIARENVVVSEEVYIVDEEATELKLKKLLDASANVLEYDPALGEVAAKAVGEIFGKFEQQLSSFDQDIATFEENLRNYAVGIYENEAESLALKNEAAFHKGYLRSLNKLISAEERKGTPDKYLLSKFSNEIKMIQFRQSEISYELNKINSLLNEYKLKSEELTKQLNTQKEQRQKKNEALINEMQNKLQINFSQDEREFLSQNFYASSIKNEFMALLKKAYSKPTLSFQDISGVNLDSEIKLKNIKEQTHETLDNFSTLTDLKNVREEALNEVNEVFGDQPEKVRKALSGLLEKMIRPSVTLNKNETENLKNQIRENLAPVFINLKQGESLARIGERLTGGQVARINSYFRSISFSGYLWRIVGISLYVFLIFALGVKLINNTQRHKRNGRKKALMVFLAIMITIVICNLWLIFAGSFSVTYTSFQAESFRYAIPAVLASLLVGILVNFNMAVFTSVITASFMAIAFNDNFYIFMYVAAGGLVASFPSASKDSRIGLVKHGLIISAVSMGMTLLIFLIKNDGFSDKLFYDLALASTSGVMASVFALFLLPFFEFLFDITTDLKLLELSNMNHPALKELMSSAPGSYQHSIMVGSLAEAAALKINANPLFCRVASYYHDIGKSKNSEYFIENCGHGKMNIHEKLNDPYHSSKIVRQHVENGVKMAKEYRLGKKITEIIEQHHGTTATKYFYIQAKKSAANPSEVKEEDFRYSGPKPQTLASAIIMLADSCEAAVRSIREPSPAKIDEMVRKVCAGILREGQLDHSGISLKQFKDIIETFLDLLTTIYHQRIAYPEEKEKFPKLIYSKNSSSVAN